jgi:hypothetical protein
MLEISFASLSVKTGTAFDLCIVATPFILSPVYEFPNIFVQVTNPVSKLANLGVSRPGGTLGEYSVIVFFLEIVDLRFGDIASIEANHSALRCRTNFGTLRFFDFVM